MYANLRVGSSLSFFDAKRHEGGGPPLFAKQLLYSIVSTSRTYGPEARLKILLWLPRTYRYVHSLKLLLYDKICLHTVYVVVFGIQTQQCLFCVDAH